MKRIFQALLVGMFAFGAISAFAEDVWIVVPDDGDTVNGNGFTLVAKAQADFSACDYLVYVSNTNEDNNSSNSGSVGRNGTNDSNFVEIVKPNMSDVDGTAHRSIDGKLPIVAHIGPNWTKGDTLHLRVALYNYCTGVSVEETVMVTVR